MPLLLEIELELVRNQKQTQFVTIQYNKRVQQKETAAHK